MNTILAVICSVIGVLLLLVGCGFCYFYNQTKFNDQTGNPLNNKVGIQMSELMESNQHIVDALSDDESPALNTDDSPQSKDKVSVAKYGELLSVTPHKFNSDDELLSDYDGGKATNLDLISDDLDEEENGLIALPQNKTSNDIQGEDDKDESVHIIVEDGIDGLHDTQ